MAENYTPAINASSFLALDGSLAPIGLAREKEFTDFVFEQNRLADKSGGHHPGTNRERLRKILMSGGDSMVLGIKNIVQWLVALSDAGIESIRSGTKELAFYPERFDPTTYRNSIVDAREKTNIKALLDHMFDKGLLMIETCSGQLSNAMTLAEIDHLADTVLGGLRKIKQTKKRVQI